MGRSGGPLLSLALVLAVACGFGSTADYGQSRTAQQIVDDASKSTGAATSFHIATEVTTKTGPGNADFDVEGSNLSGKLNAQGMNLRIVHVNDKTFVYGSDLAVAIAQINPQASAAVKARAADKWVLMPPDFWSSTGLSGAIDMASLTTCLRTEAGLSKKGTSTVSGQNVVEVDDQLSGKMFVQTAAPHYFVRVDLEGVDSCITDQSVTHEKIDLTKVGQKITVSPPSDYVDLNALANGG